MALSLSNFLYAIQLLLVPLVSAATKTYDLDVGWVERNPDGQHPRPVIGVNGRWPIPRIEVDVGDRLIVNMKNSLGNESTTIHWHGLYQNGTSFMDGVAQATQCPVPPGSSITYNFTVDQPGTYWYHSHVDGQYPDGFRGPLIVHDPENPYADLFDEELILTLSDWYHDEMPGLIAGFLSVGNPTGAEPVPNSALMNDTQNHTIAVEPGKTYFLRIINMAAFAAQYFWIEDHTFRIIEVDGIYHKPTEASQLYITAAQRYGVLLTTKNTTSTNFAIMGSMDQDLFDAVPDGLNSNVTSYLVYDDSAPLPTPKLIDEFDPFDDMILEPTDEELLYENPSMSVQLDVVMDNLGDGANYAFFNDLTYVRPKVPTIYTVMTSGNLASNPKVYGINTNTFVLKHNEVIEIVLNNRDPGKHPFHLHGHAFQAIARGDDDSGDWDPEALRNGSLTFPRTPMRRDVLLVRPNGHVVMRFRSDNPGVWLFHCHIEWHVDSGLIMTFVEAPELLQAQLNAPGAIPEDHFASCRAMDPPMSYKGNAAGNTQDLLNLDGQALSPNPLPKGFTARGIVALVFSIIAGLLGVAVIAWYGMGELGAISKAKDQARVAELSRGNGVTSEGGHGGVVMKNMMAK